MGPNNGSSLGAMDMGMAAGGVQANGASQQLPTEYTLQGVMRFLQTEWHRHERDRNAWEIERQEMLARIANLEGQARRSDAVQKALRKYVSILERKVRDQSADLKATDPKQASTPDTPDDDRPGKAREKLKASVDKLARPADDDENLRTELRSWLDQCQAEFTYLMVTPANPHPPPESPPLPVSDEARGLGALGMPAPIHADRNLQNQRSSPSYGQSHDSKPAFARQPQPPQHQQHPSQSQQASHLQMQQQHQQQQPPPQPQHTSAVAAHMDQPPSSAFSRAASDFHSQPMTRSAGESQLAAHANSSDWPGPATMATRAVENDVASSSGFVGAHGSANSEPDGWEFPEGAMGDDDPSRDNNLASAPNRPDTDAFPNADYLPKSPNGRAMSGHRRRSSLSRRRGGGSEHETASGAGHRAEGSQFKLRFGLRGHLDTVRTVIFSGGGSPGEPEICTAGDDGIIKRFHVPRLDGQASSSDPDVTANFSHRGHIGSVLSLASWSPSPSFSTGGRAQGDGWIFSGGQDSTIRVWERGRVDPKATLEGHTDAVWALCVLPTTLGAVFGSSSPYGGSDRILLVSGAADSTVRLWSVSAPPQMGSPQPGGGTGRSLPGRGGRVRGNSMSSGSGFSSSPQPTTASTSPFHHTLVHVMTRVDGSMASSTSIAPLGGLGESFVVGYSDAAVVVYDTRSGEQVGQMDSMETYDGSMKTGVNAVTATTAGLDQGNGPQQHGIGGVGGIRNDDDETGNGGPTGGRSMAGSGVQGTIISGHEDRFVRFFDANSGQCTYNMLAHPDAISSLSLSPDGRELLSAGHDASLRFWSLEKRSCTQEITSHRVMRGEGVCCCVWSQDGKWVVSAGGDGIVKVFAR